MMGHWRSSQPRETKHSDGQTGVSLSGFVRTMADGGRVSTQGNSVVIEQANAVTLLVVLNTDFRGRDARQLCEQQMAALADEDYSLLRDGHVRDYQQLFRRVQLTLGPHVARPTDERLRARIRP